MENDGQMQSEKLLPLSNRIQKWLTIFAPHRLKSSERAELVTQQTVFANVKRSTAVILATTEQQRGLFNGIWKLCSKND
jgi:hypothetical protein